MPSIFILNKQKWALVFWLVGAFINVIGNIILIQTDLGILGASISTAFAYFVMMACLVYKNNHWLPIKYNYRVLVPHAVFSILILLFKFNYDLSLMWLVGLSYFIYSIIIIYKSQKILLRNVV